MCLLPISALSLPGREYVAAERLPANKNMSLFQSHQRETTSLRQSQLPTHHLPVGSVASVASPLLMPRATGRMGLAGQLHPITGVPFNARGFPVFDSQFSTKLPRSVWRTTTRSTHFKLANQKLRAVLLNPNSQISKTLSSVKKNELLQFLSSKGNLPQSPPGYTWHHNQKTGVMELVDRKAHQTVSHDGGYKIWGRSPDAAYYRRVALQWGTVALIDFSISLYGDYRAGELRPLSVARHGTGVTASGFAAWTIRCLLETYSTTATGWTAGMSTGGPAIIISTATYIITRLLLEACWEKYLAIQRERQEAACRGAEQRARWKKIQSALKENNEAITLLFSETSLSK